MGVGGEKDGPVSRRRVYFVSGFDPNGPRRYHLLYKTEGERQAALSGYDIEIGPLVYERGGLAARWTARIGGTEAEIVMLRWDDIARRRMRLSLFRIYLLMARTFAAYVFSGAFRHLAKVRRISTWVGMYPPAVMILYLLVALGAGAGGAALAGVAGAPVWGAGAAGLLAFLGAMRLTRALDGALLIYYLMCDLGFTAAHAAGKAPEMEARIDEFAARLAEDAKAGGADEVLVVGHSSGAAYAVSVIARARAKGLAARLSFLTLGQTIPMLSFLPGATRLRAELGALGAAADLDWIDIATPADGACYALAHPVLVSGAAADPGAVANPKVLSARFGDALSKPALAALKGRWFTIHTQYLRAFDRPIDYDYFQITAGPGRLEARFRGRDRSPRTIAKPLIQKRLRA